MSGSVQCDALSSLPRPLTNADASPSQKTNRKMRKFSVRGTYLPSIYPFILSSFFSFPPQIICITSLTPIESSPPLRHYRFLDFPMWFPKTELDTSKNVRYNCGNIRFVGCAVMTWHKIAISNYTVQRCRPNSMRCPSIPRSALCRNRRCGRSRRRGDYAIRDGHVDIRCGGDGIVGEIVCGITIGAA